MNIDVKDPKFIGWLVVALLLVIIGPLYFFTTALPITYKARQAEIAQLDERHQKLARDLEKAHLLVRNLDRVEQEYEILHKQWEVAQTLLPELNEMPNLLRKVTAAGQQSGVDFELFRPDPPLHKGFYADNPIQVKVVGGYHQTGVFFSRLANLNRIVNVSSLLMEEMPRQDEQPYTVVTSMTLTAYTRGSGRGPVEETAGSQQLAASSKPAADKAAVH